MKILQVTNFFKPSWEAGGVAKVSYEISKELARRGHKVTVYTTDGFKKRLKLPKNKPLKEEGLTIFYFRNLSLFLSKRNLPFSPIAPLVARREIGKFEAIHIHEHRTFLALVVAYYARKYGIPYIVQSHGSVLPYFQKRRLKRVFDILFGYRILKKASKVFALTRTEAKQYEMMGVDKDKIVIVPNGIIPKVYSTKRSKSFRKERGFSEKEVLLLYVGRLHKSKGLDLLLDSFYEASKKKKELRLILVGPDDGYRRILEEKMCRYNLENKVVITGQLDEESKKLIYRESDIFITPKYSGFPVTFLEAALFGLPIITTVEGDQMDWINNKAGIVTDYKSSSIEKTILYLAKETRFAKKLGKAGLSVVKMQFNWKKITGLIERIYKEL